MSCADKRLFHKIGDTFDYLGFLARKEYNELAEEYDSRDFTGWTGRCQIRDKNDSAIVFDINFAWVDEALGSCTFEQSNEASILWPAGRYNIDVELTTPTGKTISTPTFELDVLPDVTK